MSTSACVAETPAPYRRWLGTRAAKVCALVACVCGMTLVAALVTREPEASTPASGEERRYGELLAQLKHSPKDERALVLKALMDQDAQRFELAASGFEKALTERSRAARDPDVWVRYAEAVAMTQGQSLAGKPSALLAKALAIAPRHPLALELAGSAAWEQGDFRGAAASWQQLLAQLPTDSERHAQVAQALARAEQRARVSLPRR